MAQERFNIVFRKAYTRADGTSGVKWLQLGKAFANRSGKGGFTLVLDTLPVGGAEGGDLTLGMYPDEGKPVSPFRPGEPAPVGEESAGPPPPNDDIPF